MNLNSIGVMHLQLAATAHTCGIEYEKPHSGKLTRLEGSYTTETAHATLNERATSKLNCIHIRCYFCQG